MPRNRSDRDWRTRFANNLQIIMTDRGFNQKDLAEAIDVNESTVSRYCSGGIVPSAPVISKLAKVLRCDPTDLI